METYFCPQCGAKLVVESCTQWCPYCEVTYNVSHDTDKDTIYKRVSWTQEK